ncbi:unnamed protein product [Mesocestoides corti]|uniref:ENTH domain-containing protein n=1 Tax=Mesocestoides corti TaxID=53468 RepID=A0A0R3U7X9_MESCO|nr:unnamed protein product [Mesocestoides corti]
MQKAINPQETPPKPKHVRAIILETHQQRSSSFLYPAVRELQVLSNQVCCWKFLIVLHKVMRSGHSEVRAVYFINCILGYSLCSPKVVCSLYNSRAFVIFDKILTHSASEMASTAACRSVQIKYLSFPEQIFM